jgi:hypothetical protein
LATAAAPAPDGDGDENDAGEAVARDALARCWPLLLLLLKAPAGGEP